MNKIEEILKTVGWKIPLTDGELEIAFETKMFNKDKVISAMKEFGRLAFEAGRDQYWDDGGTGCLEFKHYEYEDFLKEIENEKE